MLKPGIKVRLFQFEPLKFNVNILHSLGQANTTIVEAAVGAKSGKATLYTYDQQAPNALNDPLPAWSHIPSLYQRREAQLQKYEFAEQYVDIVTIDEVIDGFKLDVIDFMKLDVEGHELAVLQGSSDALRSRRVRTLTFEFGSGNVNSRTYFHDFWDLLTEYGYTIYRICPGGILLEITEYYEDLEYFRGVSNYLATVYKR